LFFFFSFSGAGPVSQLAGRAGAEERRRGSGRFRRGDGGAAFAFALPAGRGREEDRRRGAAASPWFDRDGKEGGEVPLSGEKIWAGDAAVGGDGTARARDTCGSRESGDVSGVDDVISDVFPPAPFCSFFPWALGLEPVADLRGLSSSVRPKVTNPTVMFQNPTLPR